MKSNEVEEEKAKSGCHRLFTILFLLIIALVLIGVSSSVLGELPARFIATLLSGWWNFGSQMFSSASLEPGLVISGLCFFAISLWVGHIFLSWIARHYQKTWRIRHTFFVHAITLILFFASMISIGIFHQIGWLFQQPIVKSDMHWRSGLIRSSMTYLLEILKYNETAHNQLPDSLLDIKQGDEDLSGFFFWSASPGNYEPILYHGKGVSLDSPPDTVILSSGLLREGVLFYMTLDGEFRVARTTSSQDPLAVLESIIATNKVPGSPP